MFTRALIIISSVILVSVAGEGLKGTVPAFDNELAMTKLDGAIATINSMQATMKEQAKMIDELQAVTIGNTVVSIFNSNFPVGTSVNNAASYTYSSGTKTIGGGVQQAVLAFSVFNAIPVVYNVTVTTQNVAGTVNYNNFTRKFSANVVSHLSFAFTWATAIIPAGNVVVKATISTPGSTGINLDEFDYITMTFKSAI